MLIGVILAAGEGTRMGLRDVNKTTVLFNGKPLIQYGVDLFTQCVDETYVVVGAHSESIRHVLAGEKNINYVEQTERRGTGHALIAALRQIVADGKHPELVIVGYGDHMMFYTPEVVANLIAAHRKNNAVVTLISTSYDDPDYIAWGRIIRDTQGKLVDIVEQKDATDEQRKIKESNAGFYALDFTFATSSITKVLSMNKPGEYYINDFTTVALREKKNVTVLEIPFEKVGIGINTHEQHSESTEYYLQTRA